MSTYHRVRIEDDDEEHLNSLSDNLANQSINQSSQSNESIIQSDHHSINKLYDSTSETNQSINQICTKLRTQVFISIIGLLLVLWLINQSINQSNHLQSLSKLIDRSDQRANIIRYELQSLKQSINQLNANSTSDNEKLIDPFYMPDHQSFQNRKQSINRQVPLDWLHSLRESIINNQSINQSVNQSINRSKLAWFFGNYTVFHAQSLKSINQSTRFLFFRTYDYVGQGMGNRLIGLMSAFLYSVLTDRVLILDPHSEDLSEEISMIDLFELPPIDWRIQSINQYYEKSGQSLKRLIDDAPYIEINHVLDRENVQESYENMLCGTFHTDRLIDSAAIVKIHANRYFIPLLFQNPNFRSLIESQGFQNGRVAPLLSRFLFQIRPNLQSLVDEFKKVHFRKYMIGVQVRTGDGFSTSQSITSTAFRCANVIANSLPVEWFHRNEIGVFLVSDNLRQVEKVGQKIVDFRLIDYLSYYPCPDEKVSKFAVECAVIQMFLLSEMDDLVMSKGSTFGDLSHAIGMLSPMTLTETPICMRQAIVDPCMHSWEYVKKLSCYNDTKMTQMEDTNGYCMGNRPYID